MPFTFFFSFYVSHFYELESCIFIAPYRVAATNLCENEYCFSVLRLCVFGEEDGDDELSFQAAYRLHVSKYFVIPSFSPHGLLISQCEKRRVT